MINNQRFPGWCEIWGGNDLATNTVRIKIPDSHLATEAQGNLKEYGSVSSYKGIFISCFSS